MSQTDKQQIATMAAGYVARAYSGEMSEREEAEFFEWLNADSLHQQEYQKQIDLWEISSQLKAEPKDNKFSFNRYKFQSIAATLLIVSMTLFFYSGSDVTQTDEQHYFAAIGEISTVSLADDSVINLNTNSEIKVTMSGQQRFVELVRGEAYFDVTKDPARPFIVDTGDRRITVVGTEFNIVKSEDGIQVAVTEGLVEVSSEINGSNSGAQVINNPKTLLLAAGKVGSFDQSSEVVSDLDSKQLAGLQGWRSGLITVSDENLENLIIQLNRYRKKPIVLSNEQLGKLKISGVFSIQEGQQVLKGLEKTLPVIIVETDQHTLIKAKSTKMKASQESTTTN